MPNARGAVPQAKFGTGLPGQAPPTTRGELQWGVASRVVQTMKVEREKRKRTGSLSSRQHGADVREEAVTILNRRAEDLEQLYYKPGGWELWFQGELYLALVKRGLIPLAEVKVYGGSQKADIGLQGSDSEIAIELKCESFHNSNAFMGEVNKDRVKIDNLQSGVAWQIVVAHNKADELSTLTWTGHAQVGKFTICWYSLHKSLNG
jgi:hypothetical protein